MVQIAAPIANQGTTNWEEENGDGDGDWFDELDEGITSTDDNSTSWKSPATPVNEQMRTLMASVTDPASSSGHIYRSRSRKNPGGGVQIDIIIRLFQSTTEIATESFADVSNGWVTRIDTLSGTEADNITNYGDLRTDTEADAVGGGAGRRGVESTHEFECPDAAAGGFVHSQGVMVGQQMFWINREASSHKRYQPWSWIWPMHMLI